MNQSVADFLNSIIHLPYKEQTDAIGLFLMAQEEALSTATQERDQLKESLLRLIEAERQFRFCGTPEMKTVDDVITGMRNIGDKLQSVVLAAELKELKEAAQGVCGYLITLSDGHVTFEWPVPPENLKRLEAALAKP